MGGLKKSGTWGFTQEGGESDSDDEVQKGLHRELKEEELRSVGKLCGRYTLINVSFISR